MAHLLRPLATKRCGPNSYSPRAHMGCFLNHFKLSYVKHYTSKHSAPYWSNPPLLIFDIRVLWRQSARMSKIKNDGLDQYGTGRFGRLIFAIVKKCGTEVRYWKGLMTCHKKITMYVFTLCSSRNFSRSSRSVLHLASRSPSSSSSMSSTWRVGSFSMSSSGHRSTKNYHISNYNGASLVVQIQSCAVGYNQIFHCPA